MLSSQFVHVCYVSFNKDQSINQLQYVEDSEPVTRSTLPLVNSAKTELQVQKELDKKRFLTSAPHGRGTTLGSRLFWQPAISTFACGNKVLFCSVPYTETVEYQDMIYWEIEFLKVSEVALTTVSGRIFQARTVCG